MYHILIICRYESSNTSLDFSKMLKVLLTSQLRGIIYFYPLLITFLNMALFLFIFAVHAFNQICILNVKNIENKTE